MRLFSWTLLLTVWTVTTVEAGLQSALTEALLLNQPQSPVPIGALFIDPIKSTRGQGVFREGPTFEYDPNTGGVSIVAPPMLGPADEFGVRQRYTANSIEVFSREYFSESITLPNVKKYHRDESIYIYETERRPINKNDLSFVLDEQLNHSFSISSYGDTLRVDSGLYREFGGMSLDFDMLLKENLDVELFEASDSLLLDDAIWPYLPNDPFGIPEIQLRVRYRTDRFSNLYPQWYTLLAVPQSMLKNPSQVPETSSVLLALIAVAAQFLSRRR